MRILGGKISAMKIFWFSLFFLVLRKDTYAVNIAMFPMNMNSHILYFAKLGEELAKLGHQVTLVIPSNTKLPINSNQSAFGTLSFQSRYNESIFNTEQTQKMLQEYATSGSFIQNHMRYRRWMQGFIEHEGSDMIFDNDFMEKLKDKKINFMIFDFEPHRHVQILSKLFKVPYAVYCLPFLSWRYGVPRPPSTNANFILGYTDRMNFVQRFMSLSLDLFFLYLTHGKIERDDFYFKVKEKYNIDLVSSSSLYSNASLLLHLDDFVTSFPSATTPFSISVGEIMGRPSKALPTDLEAFVSQRPAVLVSFGSYIHSFPQTHIDKFCNAFEKLRDFNFIWKVKNEAVCGRKIGNLLLRSWLPQNDLLSKVVVFISHGGYNSFVEAVYHGTPLILFPMVVDQNYQANMAEAKKIGVKMDFANWSEQELIDNILMLTSKENAYQKSANRWSSIMKDRPITAAQKVSHAIDHVIKFGDEHLKDNSDQLYWFQYFMFDVLLAFILIAFMVILSIFLTLRFIIKMVLRLSFIKNFFPKQKKV